MSRLRELLERGPVAVNIGVREFAAALERQRAQVVHVAWSPPAGGDEELARLLDRLL